MPFDSQITQLSSEQLDKFFEETPTTTPTADNLAVGKETAATETKIPDPKVKAVENLDNIPFYDESLEADEQSTEETPEETKEKAKTAKAKQEKAEQPEETTDDTQQAAEPTADNVNSVLKNTVDYLVSSGKWVDFEGREDLEITQEVYADLVAKQDEYRLSNMFNELVDSTGNYGKAIIAHIKNGGNPDEIIDLFKEQQQLTQVDTSTEEGKQQLIEKYYSEVLGWKPEKVTKTVKRLIADNEIDSEFTDVNEMYSKHYQDKLQELNKQNEAKAQADLQRQQVFVNNIKTALEEDATLSQQDKKLIASSILDFRHKLDNGQKVNDFYVKFAEMQADPKEYVDLVRFVMDKKAYKAALQRKEKTQANSGAFNFIKGNATVGKTKSTQIQINGNPDNARRGTDFSFALKK